MAYTMAHFQRRGSEVLDQYPGLEESMISYTAGVLLATIACSAALAIGVNYLVTRRNDRPVFRILVAVVGLLEIGHLICFTVDFTRCMASNFGNPNYYFTYSGYQNALFFLNGLTPAVVQGFYAWRCWTLWNRKPAILVLFSLLIAFVLGSWFSVGILSFTPEKLTAVDAWLPLVAPVVTDLCIVALMLGAIGRIKDELQPAMQSYLKRIAILTVTTNGLTTILCIIAMGGAAPSISSDANSWPGLNIVLPLIPHMYYITLLTWLLTQRPVNLSAANTVVVSGDNGDSHWKASGTQGTGATSTTYAPYAGGESKPSFGVVSNDHLSLVEKQSF